MFMDESLHDTISRAAENFPKALSSKEPHNTQCSLCSQGASSYSSVLGPLNPLGGSDTLRNLIAHVGSYLGCMS